MSDNIVLSKSMDFALRIVKLYQFLCNDKKEFILSKQLLRSGTGVGANLRESKYAQSRSDFISKCSIALKEIAETEYWLELLFKAGYLSDKQYESITNDCIEIIKLLTSIVKSSKSNN